MEQFANQGLMLPEQVWDGVGSNRTFNFPIGEGTNSATPLAWTHAEYVKLIKSLTDKNTWDSYPFNSESTCQNPFSQVFFRGTPNQWGTTPMTFVEDECIWKTTQSFGDGSSERFKFDINGDWSLNFGDNQPVDGIADQNGADIPLTEGAGTYAIAFNPQSQTYTVVKQGPSSTYPHLFLRGTPNAWETTPMNLVADFTWEVTADFGRGSSERFKFDVNGDWTNNFGDNSPQDGIGEPNGADIPITQGAGRYTITFNDRTKAYTVVKN
jgi:alpha-amylase